MRPKRIILVRHGESEGQVDPSAYSRTPDHNIGLTPKGRSQAEAAGAKLVDKIGGETLITYLSPYERCVSTFNHMDIGAKGFLKRAYRDPRKAYEDPRLREQEWGNFRTAEETERFQKERYAYGPFYYRFPNGESGADVYDRISSFLETLHRDFSKPDYPDNVLIVNHGMTTRLFIMRWFHVPVQEFETWSNPDNCQMFTLVLADGRYVRPVMAAWRPLST